MDEEDVFDDPDHNSGDGFVLPGNQSMPIKPSGVRYVFKSILQVEIDDSQEVLLSERQIKSKLKQLSFNLN